MSKTVNGATTDYYYDDAGRLYRAGDVWIFHGPDGSPMSIKYQTVRYYLVKNLQGDVVALTGPNGDIVARYTYDAWGKILSITDANGNDISGNTSHIANINPLRYRSYVYDSESGFYYLTSRYYDPTVGRFISGDGQISGIGGEMLGYNRYAYCFNDPVNMTDSSGEWPTWNQVFAVVVGVAIVATAVAAIATAAPVFAAAATVGYVSGMAAAGGTIVCATVAGVGGASIVGEAITGENPVRDLVGQENFDIGLMLATAGMIQGMSEIPSVSKPAPNLRVATSKGSTATRQPENLIEQLALEQVKSNPQGVKLPITMNDPRWPSSEGWFKMQQIVDTSIGKINIHYVYNEVLQLYDDFKLK